MKIILTEDVVGVGDIGESISVRPGFARNYLIPRGLAIESESKRAGVIAHRMRQIEAKKRRFKGAAEELAKQVHGISVEFGLRVGSGGKVFGSVSSRDIAKALAAQGVEVDRRRVLLEEPIKKVGTHQVKVKLHAEVVTEITVQVNQLEATKEEEEHETLEAKVAVEEAVVEKKKTKKSKKSAEEKTAE